MKSIIRFAVALIACTGLAWAASACNGGGASSLEDYFEEYEKLDNKAEDATADLQREFDASLTATSLNDEVRQGLQDYYTRQIEVRQDYADSVARLDPPEAARAAHDASVTSYQAVLDAFSGIVDDIGQAQTIDDLKTSSPAPSSPPPSTPPTRPAPTCRRWPMTTTSTSTWSATDLAPLPGVP